MTRRGTAAIAFPGPGPGRRHVQNALDEQGHALVHARFDEWLPAARAAPALRHLLSSRDWQRSRSLDDPAARERFVASRLFVTYTAAAALRVPPDEVDLAYKPGGRPYVRGCDQIDVSLSHTGALMAVGISRLGRVGVDIEPCGRRMPYAEIGRQLCTPAERERLGGLPEGERELRLLRLWTLKEAYTKALGQGMRLSFAEFGFTADGTEVETRRGHRLSHGEWLFSTHELAGGHLVSLARQDTGLGGMGDTAVATSLDAGFLGEVLNQLNDFGHNRASDTRTSGRH